MKDFRQLCVNYYTIFVDTSVIKKSKISGVGRYLDTGGSNSTGQILWEKYFSKFLKSYL